MTTDQRLSRLVAADPATLAQVDLILGGGAGSEDLRTLDFKTSAKRIGVSRPTIYKMVRRGDLATVRVCDRDRILVRSLVDYMTSRH